MQSLSITAAATAAWMCSAWDESDPIVVVVNGVTTEMTMTCAPPLWHAEIRTVPSP
jgi:hypothetical protein